MASVFPLSRAGFSSMTMPNGRRLARGMSRHASAAMLAFAAWQVWLAVSLSGAPGGRALPWLALVLLLLGAIPFARRLERRWQRLTADAFPCPGLVAAYRRDRARLWLLAIGLPPLLMALPLGLAQIA
jgi:hypothetical protein